MANVRSKDCEACELHRNGRFCVRLSGQLYHTNTLQEDQFMPDDSQVTILALLHATAYKTFSHSIMIKKLLLNHTYFFIFEPFMMPLF